MKDKLIAGTVGILLGAGGLAAVPEEAITQVDAAQATYFAEHGTYFQVHTYETPLGEKGYQTLYKDAQGIHSKGVGPEAVDRTFTTEAVKEMVSATSTKQ